jgi:hypothetical protein
VFDGYDPEEGENLFIINKADTTRATVAVNSNLTNKWGDYILKVKVSTYSKTSP